MSKKSETNTFVFLITAFVIGFIVIFGFLLISRTTTTVEEIILMDFASTLKNDFERVVAIRGVRFLSYEIPSIVGKVLILDLNTPEVLLRNDEIRKQPIIVDSIRSGKSDNLFFLDKQNNLINSFDVGDITVGQFGEERCSGIAVIQITRPILSFRAATKGGGRIFLGEECEGLIYNNIRGPFGTEIYLDQDFISNLDISINKQRITIRKDFENKFLSNATGVFREISINNGILDRIFYEGFKPEGTEIKFQINFGDGNFVGNDLTNETFYEHNGQYILNPEDFVCEEIEIKFFLFSDKDRQRTPILDSVIISYYENQITG